MLHFGVSGVFAAELAPAGAGEACKAASSEQNPGKQLCLHHSSGRKTYSIQHTFSILLARLTLHATHTVTTLLFSLSRKLPRSSLAFFIKLRPILGMVTLTLQIRRPANYLGTEIAQRCTQSQPILSASRKISLRGLGFKAWNQSNLRWVQKQPL